MWTFEENLTYAGQMMLDLRSNWAFDYSDRIEYVINVLESAKKIAEENGDIDTVTNITEDINLASEELSGEYGRDGRNFRNQANYYDYKTYDGLTERVAKELIEDATYPENFDFYIEL